MPGSRGVVSALAVLLAAPLLLWPAIMNGYPLLFGDTGVYVVDGLTHHVSWARPMFYGVFMLPLHLTATVWPVVVVQAVIAAAVLLCALRSFVPGLHPMALLPVVAVLAAGTSLPWFVSQLMPDVFAGLLVLTLGMLVLAAQGWGRLVALLFAAGCITLHLTLLPISLAVIATLWVGRLLLGRGLSWGAVLGAAAVPVLAVLVLTGTNAVLIGQASPSPYGKIFVLNRILVDGPGVRALERDCPRPGWTLCAFKAEIPRIADEDDMLWGTGSVLERAGGYKVVAPQAWPIVFSALRAEPGTVLWQALRNAARQFVSFRTGDALLRPSPFNEGVWRDVFPPAERARYRAGMQYRGVPLVPVGLQALHVALGAVSIVAIAVGAYAGLRRRSALGALLLAILAALAANAVVAGALSGVYDRYQSRFVWLAVFGAMLMLLPRTMRRG